MSEILCGIDLGTTNSSIAYLEGGKPIALPLEEGSAIVPSVVSLDELSGQIVIGRQAKNRMGAFPEAHDPFRQTAHGERNEDSPRAERIFPGRAFFFYPSISIPASGGDAGPGD